MTGRRWRIWVGLLAATGLFVAAAFIAVAWHRGASANESCDPNERVVTDADGKRFLELRWPLGSSEHLAKLRVPLEYVSWADTGCGSAVMPDYPDPNYTYPFASSFRVSVSLPDFEARPRSEELKFRRGPLWSSADISIHAQASRPESPRTERISRRRSKVVSIPRSVFISIRRASFFQTRI
jgi:hypothetical protein